MPVHPLLHVSLASVDRGALWGAVRAASDAVLDAGGVFVLLVHESTDIGDARLLAAVDERRRLRLRRARDREQLVLGRTLVHHLAAPPGASGPCRLEFGSHGKPYLDGAAHFNLSHSGAVVACALSLRGPVGVDVEAFERLASTDGLEARILHPHERRALDAAPPPLRRPLFERCWTRKEAVIKATGAGLAHDLRAIDVRPAQDDPLIEHPVPVRLADLDARRCGIAGAVAMPAGTRELAIRVLDSRIAARADV
jgi:4'-phosphopantetheinyl transferase